jgi:phage tail protein X
MYTTIQGDMWDIIAKKNYGNEYYFPYLVRANPQYCSVIVFDAGVVLQVPEITQNEDAAFFPPWRI